MSDGSTLASRRNRKKKKKPAVPQGEKMTAASLRGRKDGNDAHHAQHASQAQAAPTRSEDDNDDDDDDDDEDIGDLTHLSGAMLKAHKKELKSRKKKVWKAKKKKKRNPDPDLVFDPFELKRSSSFSECRLCLEPGVLRGCCGGYYCNKCFYRTDFCPGCDTSVKSLKNISDDANDQTKNTYGFMEFKSLLRGLIAKIGVYTLVLGVPTSIYYGFFSVPPTTVHGYTCSGFMPVCEIELCSNFLSHLDNGTSYYDSSGQCNNGYNGHCVCSLGCVYDTYLYTRTQGHLGLDYCSKSFNTWSIVMQDHFDDGDWDPTEWTEIKNGIPSTLCNADSANSSLIFQGEVVYRSATSKELNVAYGANVEFRLRYGNEKGCVDCCQDLYSPGVVTLSLSNNDGPFEPFNSYGIHDYKKDGFTLISELIPAEYLSENTKFKWHQDRFAGYRDTWALDNVTVLAQSLPDGWKTTDKWIDQKKEVLAKTEQFACCFGSDLCNANTAIAKYRVNGETIDECVRRIDNYPTIVTNSETTVVLSGNESTGITTSKIVTYYNTSALIVVDNPSFWLKTKGSVDVRHERADDATYALVGCMVLYLIRCLYLNGQRKCPMCNICKRCCCEDPLVKRQRDRLRREKQRLKMLEMDETNSNSKKRSSSSSSSSSRSSKAVELTEIEVKDKKTSNKQKKGATPTTKKKGGVGSAVVVKAEDAVDTTQNNNEEIIETSIVEFPVITSKRWLCCFLTVTWVPMLLCVVYVGLFLVPVMIDEVRLLVIPTSFVWDIAAVDAMIDYRNIHKGVVPKKEIDVTEDEQVLRGYGDDWERLWKYPSRFVTTTIEVPIPRLFTIIFAMVLDVLIVCQLSKQVRMDELFRPFVNQLPSCFQRLIRKKFRLNLYHNSGEIMDIPNTLLMDHLIFDDLPLDGKDVNFNDRNNERIGAIQLKRIKSVLGVTYGYAKGIAFGLVFTSVPWGCLTVMLPDSRLILPRLPSVLCGCLFAMRCLGGPLAFVDSFLLFQAFTSWNAFRYWTLSTHLCKSYCLKGGAFCMGIGILAGAVILGIFTGATWNNGAFVEVWIPWMVVCSGMFLIIGFVFGCRRKMPTRLIPILTSLGSDKPGTLITFTQIQRCSCCHEDLSELFVQEASILVFMDDARELDQWLKVQYLLE